MEECYEYFEHDIDSIFVMSVLLSVVSVVAATRAFFAVQQYYSRIG